MASFPNRKLTLNMNLLLLIVGTQTQYSIHRSSETSQLHCIDQRQRFSRCSCQNHVYAMHMQQTAWNPRIFLLRWPGDTNSRPGTHRSLIESISQINKLFNRVRLRRTFWFIQQEPNHQKRQLATVSICLCLQEVAGAEGICQQSNGTEEL